MGKKANKTEEVDKNLTKTKKEEINTEPVTEINEEKDDITDTKESEEPVKEDKEYDIAGYVESSDIENGYANIRTTDSVSGPVVIDIMDDIDELFDKVCKIAEKHCKTTASTISYFKKIHNAVKDINSKTYSLQQAVVEVSKNIDIEEKDNNAKLGKNFSATNWNGWNYGC